MDADELADFTTIKTPHGDAEADFCVFFFQGLLSSYRKDFLQSFIIQKSFSRKSMYCWANSIALSNISSDIDG